MSKNQIILRRFIAFAIDFFLIMAFIVVVTKLLPFLGVLERELAAEWIMFLAIPLAFFCYWSLGANFGKKALGLKVVDAVSGEKPTVWQFFKRSLLFSLLVSFNLVFVIPVFVSKRSQAFHDMLAGTIVVSKGALSGN